MTGSRCAWCAGSEALQSHFARHSDARKGARGRAFSLPIPAAPRSFSTPSCQEDKLQAGGDHRRLDGGTNRSARVGPRRIPNRREHQSDAFDALQLDKQKHRVDVLTLQATSEPLKHLKHLLQQPRDLQHLLRRCPRPTPKTNMAQVVRQALPGRSSTAYQLSLFGGCDIYLQAFLPLYVGRFGHIVTFCFWAQPGGLDLRASSKAMDQQNRSTGEMLLCNE